MDFRPLGLLAGRVVGRIFFSAIPCFLSVSAPSIVNTTEIDTLKWKVTLKKVHLRKMVKGNGNRAHEFFALPQSQM